MSGWVGVKPCRPSALGRLVACSLLSQGSRLPITRMHGLAAFQLSRVWFLPAPCAAQSGACAGHVCCAHRHTSDRRANAGRRVSLRGSAATHCSGFPRHLRYLGIHAHRRVCHSALRRCDRAAGPKPRRGEMQTRQASLWRASPYDETSIIVKVRLNCHLAGLQTPRVQWAVVDLLGSHPQLAVALARSGGLHSLLKEAHRLEHSSQRAAVRIVQCRDRSCLPMRA